MNRLADLHLHSTCSDGLYAPEEVVRRAAASGVSAVSLCDHDNIDGIDDALNAGVKYGVEVLSGVELSAVWGDYSDIHLLGYGFDHKNSNMRRHLEEFQVFRETRNEEIVALINKRLTAEGREPLDFVRVRALAGGTVGRPHIAMALKEKGYVRDTEDAFKRYLVPCNVAKRYFPVDEAIALVHEAGGVTSLAHPPFITSDRKAFLHLLDTFVQLGLEGIEAYNNGTNLQDIQWYIGQARRRGLLVTGGSDFHGFEEGDVCIGRARGDLKIPYRCMEEVRVALEGHRNSA